MVNIAHHLSAWYEKDTSCQSAYYFYVV